ncbi:M15 family metallopeptidase [Chitinophagaceae bacterium LB-8]|uniref:M15 family metallopeptidase n=1 Tax=Paraflavisolibacter caeni TaxID=2982496 RepID=A0A9X2XZ72_9BACT|nr:M15 family metallopeptidase [Paraflavisolibacter caeni]MCU7552131.1 M15 family metallopeptidase [Paraflavisolibacter caeni]
MPSRDIKDAHPILQEQFAKAKETFEKTYPNVTVILTATYRSPEEQNDLYAQGKTKPGKKVTNAKGGQSPHNFKPSFAIDVAFVIDTKVDWSEKWFKLFSTRMVNPKIEWGGQWKYVDYPHYVIKGWKDMIK